LFISSINIKEYIDIDELTEKVKQKLSFGIGDTTIALMKASKHQPTPNNTQWHIVKIERPNKRVQGSFRVYWLFLFIIETRNSRNMGFLHYRSKMILFQIGLSSAFPNRVPKAKKGGIIFGKENMM
jgi:hypothetical protein